jgi:hypothetical protein
LPAPSQQNRLRTAVWFRLLLALSLWQGPVLWGHQHRGVTGLAEHIARFHADNSSAGSMGWHWHLMMPNGQHPLSPNSGDQHTSAPRDLSRTANVSLELADSLHPVEPGCLSAGPANVQAGLTLTSRSSGFLATYHLLHLSQRLLCRMTC